MYLRCGPIVGRCDAATVDHGPPGILTESTTSTRGPAYIYDYSRTASEPVGTDFLPARVLRTSCGLMLLNHHAMTSIPYSLPNPNASACNHEE